MEDRLRRQCRGHGPIRQWLTSRVQVPVPRWEVGARDVEPQTGSTMYQCSDRPQVDREFVDLAGLINSGSLSEFRYLARRIPSWRFTLVPPGSTTQRRAVKSVVHCRRSGVEHHVASPLSSGGFAETGSAQNQSGALPSVPRSPSTVSSSPRRTAVSTASTLAQYSAKAPPLYVHPS